MHTGITFFDFLLMQFLDIICSPAISNDEKYLATASKDKTVNLIDLNKKELILNFDIN